MLSDSDGVYDTGIADGAFGEIYAAEDLITKEVRSIQYALNRIQLSLLLCVREAREINSAQQDTYLRVDWRAGSRWWP